MSKEKLPNQLKALVAWSVEKLGQAISDEYGQDFFYLIESSRQRMKGMRRSQASSRSTILKESKILQEEWDQLHSLSGQEKIKFAHCNSCMLELVNRCEAAYRTHRIKGKTFEQQQLPEDNRIIFVLTAHPTEARSPEFLQVFKKISDLLLNKLDNTSEHSHEILEKKLYHLLRILLNTPIARLQKPTVADEAANIYGITLSPEIIHSYVRLRQTGLNIMLRSWVGGDKDGHPGVDEKTMLDSFQQSRDRILVYLRRRLHSFMQEIDLMKNLGEIEDLALDAEEAWFDITHFKKIKKGDGRKIKSFRQAIDDLSTRFLKSRGYVSQQLQDIKDLIWLFPALVLPLEVREDSEIVALATKEPGEHAISGMLTQLEAISKGYDPKWYVRGFVLSMCESAKDIYAGQRLVKQTLGGYLIPVVPLFETEHALKNGKDILQEVHTSKTAIATTHQKRWGGRFEIMLGYSDSSKESGVFTSRYLISKAMKSIDSQLRKFQLVPVFFHGSGGSVERGGGSLKEQTEWWPASAVNLFKATIQGEMVARSFSSPEILHSRARKISDQWMNPKINKQGEKSFPILNTFSKSIQKHYQSTVEDPEFLKVVEAASPYAFLNQLKIGSRPSKRTSTLRVGGLRAIPWILCWTQTRTLFPTWWGVGSTWKSLSSNQRKELKTAYKQSKLFSSYVKALGFTIEKIELPIWRVYLEKSGLPQETVDSVFDSFVEELENTKEFFFSISGKKKFIWHRLWLEESIRLRSPMIHPLNLLQIMAYQEKNPDLLRTTVTGIACGMMTTG